MTDDQIAWSNFVINSDATREIAGSPKWSAAVAALYMSGANNGGINSFLTSTPEFSGEDVLRALRGVGAGIAARELNLVLTGLGEPLPRSTSDDRWATLDRLWHDELDDIDVLSNAADEELMTVLERHVADNREIYLEV